MSTTTDALSPNQSATYEKPGHWGQGIYLIAVFELRRGWLGGLDITRTHLAGLTESQAMKIRQLESLVA